jgi:predicted Zn-dependent protease with MMP-like domain
MERDRFEDLAREAFENLPPELSQKMENVVIVVEDCPTSEVRSRMKLGRDRMLLGLYEGVPLSHRGSGYGAYPVPPDKISLYQKNIERIARGEKEIAAKIREVLIHEIAHHFGMNEQQIREAGY